MDELSGRELIIGSFGNALKSLFKGTNALREGITGVFGVSPESVKGFLQNVYKVTSAFALSDKRAEQFKELVVAMGQPIRSVGIVAKKFIGGLIGDSFDGLLPKIQKYYGTAFDNVYTYFRRVAKLYKSFEDSAYVNKAVKKFSEAFNNFGIDTGIKFDEIGKKIKGYFQKTFVGSAINKYVTRWNKIWGEMNTGGKNAFDTLIRAGKEFRKQWIDTHGEDWNFFSSLWSGIQKDFKKFKESKLFEDIRKPFDSLFKKIDKLFGKKQPEGVLVGLKGKRSLFGNLVQSIQNGIQLLKTSLTEGWFSDQLKTVGTAYQRAVKAFKNTFSQDENNVFDSIKEGLRAFWKTLKYGTKGKHSKFTEAIEKVFSDLSPKDSFISKLIGGIKEKFFNIVDTISSIFKKNKKGVKGSLDSDGGFLDQLQIKLTKFWNWAKPLLQTMAETFAKSFNLQNLSQFINAITGLLFGINFSKVSKGFGNFLTSLSEQTGEFLTSFNGQTSEFFNQHTGILATIKDILTNVKNYSLTDRLRETLTNLVDSFSPLKDTKRELKARSIMEFAIALGIVAGALYLISGISTPDLIKAGIVVAAITAVLAGIGALISHFGNIKFQVALSGTGQMLKLIALILAISIALKNVGKAAQGIATAVDMLIGAVEKFSDLAVNKIKFQEAIRAVQDLIFALGTASALAGLGLGNLFGGTALTILSFAGAIRILYDAIEKITSLSMVAPDNLDQSIKAIGELIMKLGQSAALAGLTNGSWKDAGAAETILALTGAIEILQNAVFAFAAIPVKKLENSVNAITNLLNALGKASFWSGFLSNGLGGFGRAATIFAFGKSIEMLVGSIESIMKLSVEKERFKLATDTVNSILSTLEWMSIILGVANRFGAKASMSQAAGIIAFGYAIRIIGESIEGLGKLNKERLVQGGNAVGLIGTLIAGFTAILGVVNKYLNLSIKELGSAAMIIAFGTAIGNIANTVIKLGDLDAKKMKKGLDATWSIAGIVATLTAVSSLFNKGAKFSGFNFITIATGIYIFGQAIEKLGGLDDKVLLKGGSAISALALVIASCIALMNIGAKVPSWTNAVNIAALAGAVWVLADAAKTFASLNGKQLGKAAIGVVGLLAALTLISRRGLASGDIGTLFNSLSLIIIAGTISLLAEIAKSFADFEDIQLRNIGLVFGGLLVGIRSMSSVISAGAKINIGALLKFSGVVVIIGGILAAIGGLMEVFPSAPGLMSKGGDFLGQIGSAIGKFIGGIGGGIGEALAASMPAIGKSLSDFATNAKPFFDLIADLNGLDVGAILLSLVATENIAMINEGLGRIFAMFDKSKFEFTTLQAFGAGLSSVAPGVEAFIAATKDGDPSKINAVADALKQLRLINSTDVSSEDKNPLADFAANIVEASTSIEEAVTALNGLPTLSNNASTVIDSLIRFANTNFSGSGVSISSDIDAGLGNLEEGVLPYFKGKVDFIIRFGNGLKEYLEDLKNSTKNISDFVTEVNKITFEYDNASKKTKLEVFADVLSKFAEIDLPTGSLFYNQGAFGRMTSDLSGSFKAVKTFADDINENYVIPDKDKLDSFIGIIERMAAIVMPGNPHASGSEGFFMTVDQLVATYAGAASQIGIVADEIEKEVKNFDVISKLADILNLDEKSIQEKTSSNGIPKLLRTFVENIEKELKGVTFDDSITTGLQGIADILSPIEGIKEFGFSEVATDITSGISKLASINQSNGDNDLLAASETIAAFSTFVRRINSIQNGFNETKFGDNLNKMITLINENMSKLTSGSRTNMNRMREFFESVKELYGDKYHFETGAGNKFGTLISSLVNAIDMFSPNTSIDELEAYTNWMEDLAGKQDMFESAGKAIGAFAVDTNKLNSVTSFIDALKGEFNFTPGDSIFKTDPGETGGHWEKTAGYFSKVANDIVLALTILKGSEKNPVDFTEFDTLTSKLSSLATAMSQFTGTNNVSEKMRELVKGINDAILGDGTDENPGIKDFGDKLSQFDALQPVFNQLEGFQTDGLKDVVPNILSGITNAINNFSFDPNGIQLLKEAMTGIRESLDILNGEEGGPKNRLFGKLNKGGRNRVSKASDVIGKIEKKNSNEFNLVDTSKAKNMGIIDLAFAIDNLADSYERLNEETDEDRAKRISEETDKMESYYQSSIKDYESYKNLYDRYVEAHPGSENPLSFWDLLFNYDPELDNPYREELNRASKELEKTKAEYEKLLELDKELNPEKYIPVQNDVVEETLNETLGSSDLFINAIEGIADAVNGIEIDQSKTDLLVNLAESISEAAEGITKDSPSSMAKFVQVLANSIADNSDITKKSADILIQDMFTVFENYIKKFIAAGVEFVKSIASGMENTPDAVEMAATMATRILTQFTLAAQTFGGQKGKEMLDSVLGGLTSQESREAINSAFDSLFGSDENLDTGMSGEGGSIGKRIGSTFASDFMEGFTTNLNFGEGENFGGIFQSITELVTQLSEMDGNEAGMEFSTFMTDFAESAAEVMKGDAGKQIEATCNKLSSAIGSAVPDGEGLGYSFVEGIRDGLLRGIADFGAEISSLAAYLGGLMNSGTGNTIKIGSPSKTAMQMGEYFVEGLKLGIEKNLYQAYGAGASVGNAAIDGTTTTLDINSPSRVLYGIGEYAVDGFVEGVKHTTGEAAGAFSDMANLSIDEAMTLIRMLQNASGPVSFKGRTWNKSDIDYLQKYISSIQNATSATEKLSKNMESVSDAEGPVKNGASGGGGGNGQSSDKKNNNLPTTEVKGNKLTYGEVGTVLKGIIENGGLKGSFEYNGTEYNFKDLPKEFISANKDYFVKVFGGFPGFTEGLESLLGINVEATDKVGDGVNKLSSVWEFNEVKVGLTKDALFSLNEQQNGLFNSAVNRIIEGTAQSTKHEENDSVGSSNSNGKSTGGNVYNFNQHIVGSKAASRAEIYRQTKNQFSQLKAIDTKVTPYVGVLT